MARLKLWHKCIRSIVSNAYVPHFFLKHFFRCIIMWKKGLCELPTTGWKNFFLWFSGKVHRLFLKVTVSRDCWPHILLTRFDLGPIWAGENSLAHFVIFARYSQKTRVSRSPQTHRKLFYFGKSKKKTKKKCNLIFSKIVCPRSRWLCGHDVSVVVDYMDTVSV